MEQYNIELENLVSVYGVWYVIKHYILTDAIINKIITNEFSTRYEDEDITCDEIHFYQKLLTQSQ